jgi:hypothetical protein
MPLGGIQLSSYIVNTSGAVPSALLAFYSITFLSKLQPFLNHVFDAYICCTGFAVGNYDARLAKLYKQEYSPQAQVTLILTNDNNNELYYGDISKKNV